MTFGFVARAGRVCCAVQNIPLPIDGGNLCAFLPAFEPAGKAVPLSYMLHTRQ